MAVLCNYCAMSRKRLKKAISVHPGVQIRINLFVIGDRRAPDFRVCAPRFHFGAPGYSCQVVPLRQYKLLYR
jgi:hypothetical protein